MNRPILRAGETCAAVFPGPQSGLLVDGCDYYRELYRAACDAERYVLLAGWQFDSRVALLRGHDAEDAPYPVELLPFLNALCDARPDLHVYVLAWNHSLLFSLEREPLALFKLRGHERVHFVADGVHPIAASHHQKFVVVDRNVAFVGGLDVCGHRWDDRRHRFTDELRRDPLSGCYSPYHDIQGYVTGDAVDLLTTWFCERWRRATGDPLALPAAPRRPVDVPSALPVAAPSVALARTLPTMADPPLEPCFELKALHLAAIAAARRCIYLENQYFTSDDVFRALLERFAAPADPPLEVVFIVPQVAYDLKERLGHGIRQDHLLAELTTAAARGGHRLGIFCAVAPCDDDPAKSADVYIHAKLLAVDDRFLLVTSANTTNRSMGLDTELGLAWESPEPTATIRDVRVDLLREHTGLPPERAHELLTPLPGLVGRLEALVESGAGRLRHRNREAGRDLLGKLLPDDFAVDPAGPFVEQALWQAQEADDSGSAIEKLSAMWRRFMANFDPARAPERG